MPVTWPGWWEWELELTTHLEERMADRDFNEIDLRTMLENTHGYRPDVVEGRWVIETRHRRRRSRSDCRAGFRGAIAGRGDGLSSLWKMK